MDSARQEVTILSRITSSLSTQAVENNYRPAMDPFGLQMRLCGHESESKAWGAKDPTIRHERVGKESHLCHETFLQDVRYYCMEQNIDPSANPAPALRPEQVWKTDTGCILIMHRGHRIVAFEPLGIHVRFD
jgi:hypothetical protein